MLSAVRSEVRELDIGIHDPEGELDDVELPSGKSKIAPQVLTVRYQGVGKGRGNVDLWVIASIDVYGQIRSKVTGGLTAKCSRVAYNDLERECPAKLMAMVEKHVPGIVFHLTK